MVDLLQQLIELPSFEEQTVNPQLDFKFESQSVKSKRFFVAD
jgi:hypothetical protein